MRLLPVLLVALVTGSAEAGGNEPCATPRISYRYYHDIVVGRDGKEERITIFDEVTTCLTEKRKLSFDLRVVGDEREECRIRGHAEPRQEDIFVFLDGGLRLRFENDTRKIKIEVDSGLYESMKYSKLCSSISVLEFRRHSEQDP